MLPFYRTETSHPPFAHDQVLTNVCSKISWIRLNHSVPFLIYCTPNAEFIRLNYRSSLSKFCCYVNNDRWNQKGKKSRDFVPVSLDADTENTESVPLSSCAVSRGYEKSLERCTVMLQFKERDTLTIVATWIRPQIDWTRQKTLVSRRSFRAKLLTDFLFSIQDSTWREGERRKK